METLKPCPFCGGTKILDIEGSTFRWKTMECAECGATCGEVRIRTLEIDTEKDMADLHEAWNSRSLETELLKALEEAETLVSTLTDPKAKVPHRADVARELLPRIQKVINRARGKQP